MRTLLKHVESKHEGVKFLCDQCNYKATQKGHLKAHIQSKHENVKFHCDKCDFKVAMHRNYRKERKT